MNRETTWAVLIVTACVAFNLVTLSRRPKVWTDEVQDTDVAANMYFDGSFISRAHSYGTTDETFSVNPAYHFLLYLWFKSVGFGIFRSRLFDVFMISVTGMIAWTAARRMNSPASSTARLLMLSLILSSSEFVRVYRGHRYDLPALLLIAVAYLAISMQSRTARRLILFMVSALLPLTSFGATAFSGILCLSILAWCWRDRLYDVVVIAGGIAMGLTCYAVILASDGALVNLLHVITVLTQSEPGLPRLVAIWRRMLCGGGSFSLSLFMLACWIILSLRTRRPLLRSPLLPGFLSAAVVPLGMSLLGRYSYYYAWMTMAPALYCSAVALDPGLLPATLRRLLILLMLGICCAGLPLYSLFGLLEWRELDYRHVESFVQSVAVPEDTVLSDDPPYYALRTSVSTTFLTHKIKLLTPQEKSQISLIILSGEEDYWRRNGWFERLTTDLGGRWELTSTFRIPRNTWRKRVFPQPSEEWVYDLRAYRKTEDPRAGAAGAGTSEDDAGTSP